MSKWLVTFQHTSWDERRGSERRSETVGVGTEIAAIILSPGCWPPRHENMRRLLTPLSFIGAPGSKASGPPSTCPTSSLRRPKN